MTEKSKEQISKFELTSLLAEFLGDTQAQLKKSEINNLILSSIIAILIIIQIAFKFV